MPDYCEPDCTAPQLAAIERHTQEIGRGLFARLGIDRPAFWQRRWWDERILNWAMRDEAVKVQLFRFVDVLPMLDSADDLVQHLVEYLGTVSDRLPATARVSLGAARRLAITRAAVARAARLSAQDFARRFIAGVNVREVVAAALRERQLGRAFTLDILGEAVTSEAEAQRYFVAYQALLDEVSPEVNAWPENPRLDWAAGQPLPRMNLSIKLSALDSQFDAIDPAGSLRRAGGRLRELLRLSARRGAFLNVDMESYEKKDLTLHIFRSVLAEPEFAARTDVGIVVQCYLRDSGADLAHLRQWAERRGAPVWVRLVKGAYWDYETVHASANGWPVPVYRQKWETDANYERLTRFALLHWQHLRPALGSHNLRSLAQGAAAARVLEVPGDAWEAQMLYGMADAEKQALVDLGVRLRIYMPYGELIPGMAYLVRRLLENTSNDSFLRASLVEQVAAEKLLAPPVAPPVVPEPSSLATSEPRESSMTTHLSRFENEPPVDFARDENRRRMNEALAAVRAACGRHYPLVIGGQEVDTHRHLVVCDPSQRSRRVGTVAAAERHHIEQAVTAAHEALPAWQAQGMAARAAILRRAAGIMRQRLFELAAWAVYECGKPWREATGDVAEAIDFCEYYAAGALEMALPHGLTVPGEENRFDYLPRGVVGVIAPWNFPLAILTGMTAAALVTGNTVVLKPAEQASVMAWHLWKILSEAGVPPGVVHYCPGTGETAGAALVEHPRVAVIAFTGSRGVGLAINARAAAVSTLGTTQVKRVIAEMGGKNAILIDDDADLDEAVAATIRSAFGYAGQKCSACSRVIVLAKVYEAFVNRLVEAARSMQVGPADEPGTVVGPLIDAASLAKVQSYIALGRSEGRERLAVDVGPLAEQGFFVGPHIFSDLSPRSRLAQEEVFGPVLAVLQAGDFSEAIALANDTDYALTAGLFSRSPANLERARRELAAGNLYLNRGITGALVARQPFGGYRLSGIGSKAGGPDYLLQFVVPRTVTENTLRRGFAPPEA